MVSKRKKKYESGEGAQFISRRGALKRLQLTLKDFRRLCILKGIYPREPRNRKRAQQGSTAIKTLYHIKDIQFLMKEEIVWKIRDFKIFNKKVGRARALRDFSLMRRYLDNHPTLKLDHIVKERYPTFIDALRDLDDCLTLCFLFSTFPSIAHVPREHSILCRRLSIEFLHAVIEAKALRKVFVSIKGYYYQAEIKGQTITWIVPHNFSFEPQSKDEVDFTVMSTFVEFYTIMLGFVNFRLYHSLNIYYPPKFASLTHSENEQQLVDEEAFVSERTAALNVPLSKISIEDTQEDDVDLDLFPGDEDPQKHEEYKKELEKQKKLKTLFKGMKFYLNREVPRENLVFILRCFGGEVSYDKDYFVGSTFDENDESITHQIVDRPSMSKQYMSRYYVQPQWVFDSVNARTLLPTSKYLMGAVLPPHLSPFINKDRDQTYIPPEQQALDNPELVEDKEDKESSAAETSEDEDVVEDIKKISESKKKKKKGSLEIKEVEPEEAIYDEDDDEETRKEKQRNAKKQKMAVTTGEVHKEIPWKQDRQDKQEYLLRTKMIKNKHRKLYKSMKEGQKDRAKEIWLLRKKRRLHDEEQKVIKKQEKKAQKVKAFEGN